MIQRFEVVTAAFRPRRTDDLAPGVERFIGAVGRWQAAWIIEPEDAAMCPNLAPYVGLCAVMPCYEQPGAGLDGWPGGWVPECDIERINEEDGHA